MENCKKAERSVIELRVELISWGKMDILASLQQVFHLLILQNLILIEATMSKYEEKKIRKRK